MKSLFTKGGVPLLLVLTMTILPSCHKNIRLKVQKDTPAASGEFFPGFVAGKLTDKFREVMPDTLIRADLNFLQLPKGEKRDIYYLHLEGKYPVAGIEFTRDTVTDKKAKIIFYYKLKQFVLFASGKLRERLTDRGRTSQEFLDALDLCLELLLAYYESRAGLPLEGKLAPIILPHSAYNKANGALVTATAYLSKLQVIFFQVETKKQRGRGNNKSYLYIKMGWNAGNFEKFLTDVLAGKYKVDVVDKTTEGGK